MSLAFGAYATIAWVFRNARSRSVEDALFRHGVEASLEELNKQADGRIATIQ